MLFFIILQIILLVVIALHDWVHVPPLTDIHELKKHHSISNRLLASVIYSIVVLIPLSLTVYYDNTVPFWAAATIVGCYGMLTLGTIASWWIPYLFHSSEQHKKDFAEYRNTHHFLPAIRDNVIPNTFHVLMHLIIWSCFAVSLYLLFINKGIT